jgi:very-short-patch-repair endonuclease
MLIPGRPQTDSEELLSSYLDELGLTHLCNKKLCGYYPDILFPEYKLIIEVQGGYHNHPKQKLYDRKRQKNLEAMGYRILYFSNEQIRRNIRAVLRAITSQLEEMGYCIIEP